MNATNKDIRLCIFGSRDFTDYEFLCKELEPLINKVSCVISGTARGADFLGEQWAKEHNIPIEAFPADWKTYGKAAGYIRNGVLADNCNLAYGFWDGRSRGTQHMINICNDKGVPCKIIRFR